TTFVYGDNVLVAPERVARVIRPGPSAPTSRYVYLTGHTDVVGPRCFADSTTCPNQWSQEAAFDNRNRLVRSTDALGNSSYTAYDSSNNALTAVTAAGERTDTTYAAEGREIATLPAADT